MRSTDTLDARDFRDAAILWFSGNASIVIASALVSYADALPLPLTLALYGMAITLYTTGAGLIGLGGLSAVAGWRKLP